MSARFEALLGCIEGADCLADIGCDHAYIAIEAVKRKLAKKAIACDISPGPLGAAKKNVEQSGVHVEVRLGDGLGPLRENEADVIIIAGMGGMRILGIIAQNMHKVGNALIILQPQHDLDKLRRGLCDLGFAIVCEKLAKEDGRFYEIIVAKKTDSPEMLSDMECFLGSHSCGLAMEFYLLKKEKIEKYVSRITDGNLKEKAEWELEAVNARLLNTAFKLGK